MAMLSNREPYLGYRRPAQAGEGTLGQPHDMLDLREIVQDMFVILPSRTDFGTPCTFHFVGSIGVS